MSPGIVYAGSELELFLLATNWKTYWGELVRPYLGATVVDIGAGIGATAELLCNSSHSKWLALEPDPRLAAQIATKRSSKLLPAQCAVYVGTVADLAPDTCFHSALYIDVLEHIADDRVELERIVTHIAPGGHLVILSPAHEFLFSPFDAAIGHFRRYTKRGLNAIVPGCMSVKSIRYLDSVGVLASVLNRYFLRLSSPTVRSIKVWDRFIVPLSKSLDPLLGYRVGKSVLLIAQKQVTQSEGRPYA